MSTVSKVYYKLQYNSGDDLVFVFMNSSYMPLESWLESGDNLKSRALDEKWKCDSAVERSIKRMYVNRDGVVKLGAESRWRAGEVDRDSDACQGPGDQYINQYRSSSR